MNHTKPIPRSASIIARREETPSIVTLDLQFDNTEEQDHFEFQPGQFNMVYLPGVGEIAISLSSDPEHNHFFSHTVRAVGRVSRGISQLTEGQHLGIRGPFGCGWPVEDAKNKNVIVISGGLGCAPTVSVIHYILNRESDYKANHHSRIKTRQRFVLAKTI